MNKSYIKKSLLIYWILLGCLFAQDIPDWITNIPSDDDYFWAREEIMTLNMNESEYKTKANEQALLTISMQIKATVSGTVEMSATETTESLDESFTMKTFSSTMADIEGAEKVGEYQMAAKYWVLWRLKKSTHQESMARHVESAIGFYEGFTYVSDSDPVTQLQYLISAYENIVKVVGMDVVFEEDKNLKVVIPNKINEILNHLSLTAVSETDLTGQVGYPLSQPLQIKIETKKGISNNGIPIRFSFSSGEGEFEKETHNTSINGKASCIVNRIISRDRIQRVRAQVDLNELRENRMSRFPTFEAHLNEISQTNSVSFTIDVAEVTQEKIAVITVGDTLIYSEDDLKRLNRSFRSEFADVTDFKLKDEALIEGIIEDYKRSATLCSNKECQIQIGKKLGVEKLIFIDIADYPKQTSVTIILRNIAENELEREKPYKFPHDSSIMKEEKIQMIDDNITEMVNDFWLRVNPAKLTITTNKRGVKALFTHLNPTQWMDTSFEKRLPLRSENFLEGDYEISIDNIGFEPVKKNIQIGMGGFPEDHIEIVPKTQKKAFIKSLILPGLGQLYSSDANNTKRKYVGFAAMGVYAGSTILVGLNWGTFFTKKKDYEDANRNYLNQKLLEDVQIHRGIAEQKNQTMLDQHSTALVITGVWGTIWLGSALEAMLNFPYKDKRTAHKPSKIHLAIQNIDGFISPTMNWSYTW